MSFESLNRKIWKMWKQGKPLIEIVDHVLDSTGWSRYVSLVHVVRYLCGEKNVQIDRKRLRSVFNSTRDDFDKEDAAAAWRFLLDAAGIV